MQNGITVIQPASAARAVQAALARIDGRADDDEIPIRVHLAMLAAGRFTAARRRLTRDLAAPELPLLAARYAAWTADLHAVAAAWATVRASAEALLREQPHAHSRLLVMTCTELQRTATDIGDPAFAAVLLRRATAPSQPAPAHAGHPDDDDMAAADVILDFVHGTLGIEPDATRNRLRIRPGPDTADTGIEVRSIRFGDGAVNLRGSTDRHNSRVRHNWRVSQDAGAIPLTVLLEPVITGTVTGCSVDGRPASLSPQPVPGGTAVPVQLVLDDERSLDIDVDP
ncbi:hypothetical protein BH23GEM10_BH23GEM10_14220 [soil metagenome]